MMSKVEEAVDVFEKGISCSQSVFSTFSEQLGLSKELALKISAAFGGGMAHLGETCGAVTGAFMLIGLKHGRIGPDDIESKEKTYELVKEFTARFKALHGSIKCTDLIGCNLSTEIGLKVAKENNLSRTVCPVYVKSAAEIIDQILFNK
jgi:C_GCAxxG_C_C family probable redox protein